MYQASYPLRVYVRVLSCSKKSVGRTGTVNFRHLFLSESYSQGGFPHSCWVRRLCEFFYIAVNTKAHTIHPAIERASQNIWVCGPDAHGAGKHWMVDCRGSHTKSTTFKVKFWWSDWRKRVEWEEVTDFTFVPEPLAFKHRYSMAGS